MMTAMMARTAPASRAVAIVVTLALLAALAHTSAAGAGSGAGVAGSKRIAVVGGGVSGCAAALLLQNLTRTSADTIEIVVFEKASELGATSTTTNTRSSSSSRSGKSSQRVCGEEVESGRRSFVAHHLLLNKLVDHLGLGMEEDFDTAARFGVWNGIEFLIEESSHYPLTILKLIWRYGPSMIFTRSLAYIYDISHYSLLYTAPPAKTLEALLKHAGMADELIQSSFAQYVKARNLYGNYHNEIINSMTRAAYGQHIQDMSAAAVFTALPIVGSHRRFVVPGGSKRLTTAMCNASLASIRTDTKVTRITKAKPSSSSSSSSSSSVQYQITSKGKDGNDKNEGRFDYVLLASPLATAEIEFQNMPASIDKWNKKRDPSVHIFATFVFGQIKPSSFGYENIADVPEHIVTTANDSAIPFLSIALKHRNTTTSNCTFYRVLSKQELNESVILSYFSNITEVVKIPWETYAMFSPSSPSSLPPIVLDEPDSPTINNTSIGGSGGVYYLHAFTSLFASTEFELIMARNAAMLVAEGLDRPLATAPAATPAATPTPPTPATPATPTTPPKSKSKSKPNRKHDEL